MKLNTKTIMSSAIIGSMLIAGSANAGNCNPSQVALETAIAVATKLPAKMNPVIWTDMDYTKDHSQCEGNVAVGNIYDSKLLWLTTAAPK